MKEQPAPEMEHVDGTSLDIAARKRRELLELFPEARTEGGKIEFERLKLALGEAVDVNKERYGLSWPGKADCFKTIQAPSMATLLPLPEKSVNFDTTDNVMIEGDNLEVLKLLQKSYLGKIKMIYIDPPYNTGNDFIYPDDYSESLQTYLEYTGQIDSEGRKFGTNADTDGRFHSKWLNMMYPRLYLARNLLRDDGVMFVSIDDGEQHSLRAVLDNIFGEENFIAQIVWKKKYIGGKHAKHVVDLHEFILLYGKNADLVSDLVVDRPLDELEKFELEDEFVHERGKHYIRPLKSNLAERKTLIYPIELPDKSVIETQWMVSRSTLERLTSDGRIVFKKKRDGSYQVYRKFYERDNDGHVKLPSIIDDVSNSDGKIELKRLFDIEEGRDIPFPNPKPSGLMRYLLSASTGPEDIVLDFFAGSGTTGQAVLDANRADGGNRQFILVQLPEPTRALDYPTISDITEARLKRAIEEMHSGRDGTLALQDLHNRWGFKTFGLAESNVVSWDSGVAHDQVALNAQMNLNVDHLRRDRGDLDLLYEITLKEGFPLSSKVEREIVSGKVVYSVAGGAFFICLERHLDLELLRAMSERKPERVLLLDEGFAGNDQLKTNAVQTFKAKNIVLKTL